MNAEGTTMPCGMVASRTSETIAKEVVRDHGKDVQVLRAFLDPRTEVYSDFRIGDGVWRYDTAGDPIDTYGMHKDRHGPVDVRRRTARGIPSDERPMREQDSKENGG